MKTRALATSLALGLILTLLFLLQIQAAQPDAVDDGYTTSAYIPLSINAPGVLGNDTGSGTLTATLAVAPQEGTILLNSDGSFVYTPTAGFAGVDSFTYWADDGSSLILAAYWPFEEGNPVTTTVDATGNGHDGTLANGPLFTTTAPATLTLSNSYAVAFDGVDDVIAIPSSDLINQSAQALRTVSAWFNVRDKTISDTKQVIWEEGGFINGLNIYVHEDALYVGAWSNDTGWSGTWLSTTAILSNRWHHVALVLDGGGTLDLYLDGQSVAAGAGQSIAQHNNAIGIGQAQSDTKFHDGNSSGGGHAFGGLIDDVRVYNQALSTAQVQEVMTGSHDPLGNLSTVTLTVTGVTTGTLAGTVTDSATGLPIENADVQATYNALATYAATTGADGTYGWIVPTFSYTVTASTDYGYYPETVTDVVVTSGATRTLNIPLDPIPTHVVSGIVSDTNTGWPLYARIDIEGYPGGPVWTDPLSGYYSVTLAAESIYTFTVQAWVDGYLADSRIVSPLTGDASEDFALNVDTAACTAPGYAHSNLIFSDGFESGDLLAGGWVMTTTNQGRVRVSTDDPYAGAYSVLLDSAVDGADSTAGITRTFDLSTEPQVYLSFWWHEYADENDAGDGVFLSDDGGATWCQVFSFNNGPSSYTHTVIDLTAKAATCSMSLDANTQLLFQFDDNTVIPIDGYTIDKVKLQGVCLPPTNGGLAVGHVYDDNTGNALSGSTIETALGDTVLSAATPDDPATEDGLYIAFAPAGSTALTATMEGGYGSDIDLVTVPLSDTVSHDFYLPAGRLAASPQGLSVTLDLGASTILPLTLSNGGNVDAGFELVELNGGFTSATLKRGRIEWLYRDTMKLSASQANRTDSGDTIQYPGAYRYTAAYEGNKDYNILVYTDDWVHNTPDTLVQQALTNLGLSATVHVNGDYEGFQDSLNNSGPWDLVVWSGENVSADSSVLSDLLAYLKGGGRLAATYWRQLDYPDHALWTEMGFSYISNYVTPPSAYWWEPTHLLFTNPTNAPQWIDRVQNSSYSQGTRLEPLANGIALAGYATSASANEAAIVLRNDGGALYKGLRDVSTNADENGNGILDGTELWMNILYNMIYEFDDVPWLAENPITGTVSALDNQAIDITFDAGAVSQPGTYYARLSVSDDTPYSAESTLVTMTVNTPSAWGQVNGTLTSLGHCDGNPTTLAYYDVLIEDSTGAVYSTTTDSEGYYQWWIDDGSSPVTITAAIPGYQEQTETGIAVKAGQTTTVDFDLRWLQPCVSVSPASYEQVVALGSSVTGTLDLINSGALSTTFELTETVGISWLSQSPVTGTIDPDSAATIDLIFDSAALTQTGWYSDELWLLSDDPVSGSIAIPIDLWVVSGTAGVTLGVDDALTGTAGTGVTYTLAVTNTGTEVDIYDLTASGNAWPISMPASTDLMSPSQVYTLTIIVTIPADAAGSSDVMDIIARSRVDSLVSDSATLTTMARYIKLYMPIVQRGTSP